MDGSLASADQPAAKLAAWDAGASANFWVTVGTVTVGTVPYVQYGFLHFLQLPVTQSQFFAGVEAKWQLQEGTCCRRSSGESAALGCNLAIAPDSFAGPRAYHCGNGWEQRQVRVRSKDSISAQAPCSVVEPRLRDAPSPLTYYCVTYVEIPVKSQNKENPYRMPSLRRTPSITSSAKDSDDTDTTHSHLGLGTTGCSHALLAARPDSACG